MTDYRQLLTDNDILIINKDLACAVGLNPSIFLRQLAFWLEVNEKTEKAAHFRDGRWWSFNTYEDWAENDFPFWSASSIRRHIETLEALGLVITTAEYNRLPIDNTKWYTIDYEAYDAFMEVWDALGRPKRANSNSLSGDYRAFLAQWEEVYQAPSVQSEQTSAQSEQTICSEWTDGLPTVSRPLPEESPKESPEESPEEPPGGGGNFSENKRPNLFTVYETHFGLMPEAAIKKLRGWLDEYPERWCEEALLIAKEDKARKPWAYAAAILERWYRDGYDGSEQARSAASSPDYAASLEEALRPRTAEEIDAEFRRNAAKYAGGKYADIIES